MTDQEILKYVHENNLSSYLNDTKWKKLVSAITSDPNFNPPVNYKTIFDKENNGDFSPVWWEELERDDFSIIEWLEIKPQKEEQTGRFTKPKVIDFTQFIQNCLEENSINYSFENGIFKITGYYRAK